MSVTAVDKPYWILRRDQIQCLASPARQDILDHLAAGGVMSIKEIAAVVGRKPSSVYHHAHQLLDAELIEDAGSRIVNRRHERLFRTPSKRMRMIRALAEPSNRELMKDLVSATLRQSERDMKAALDRGQGKTEGPARNLGVFRLVNAPTPESLARINEKLDEIAEILWAEAEPDQPRVVLSWSMAPLSDS